MGKLLEWFVAKELYKDTAIILMSDHGIGLWEHGTIGHGMGCHEEVIHVPLFVYWPGKTVGLEEVDDLVSVVDIMPTILEEGSVGYGVNLFERQNDRTVFFEYKRQRKIAGVEQEFKEKPERDVFVRGVRWQDSKLTYSKLKFGGQSFELHSFKKKQDLIGCFVEGVKRLRSVYTDFPIEEE